MPGKARRFILQWFHFWTLNLEFCILLSSFDCERITQRHGVILCGMVMTALNFHDQIYPATV